MNEMSNTTDHSRAMPSVPSRVRISVFTNDSFSVSSWTYALDPPMSESGSADRAGSRCSLAIIALDSVLIAAKSGSTMRL